MLKNRVFVYVGHVSILRENRNTIVKNKVNLK